MISVHVEEHAKFFRDRHIGHTKFFRLLLDTKARIPFTLLIARVKEDERCLACDKEILEEILSTTNMEVGLHIHPSLAAYPYKRQKKIILREYKRFIMETGMTPRTFSGGHWCVNNDTLKIIRELGIAVDASVVPGCVVTANNGAIVKHGDSKREPYWVSESDLWTASPNGVLLETPVSIDGEGRILDLCLMPLWDIRKHLCDLSRSDTCRAYLHMTFHSYDVFSAGSERNFIYGKILHVCDLVYSEFKKVNFVTCFDYYSHMKETYEAGH
ncbi:MAG: hypothetical protein HQM16_01890 [Deltaproteobacteria bacterium]|nr:hypothetical protein [Deltaproteobacteria bacterium]